MPNLAYGISNRRVRLAEICSGLADRLFRGVRLSSPRCLSDAYLGTIDVDTNRQIAFDLEGGCATFWIWGRFGTFNWGKI